MKYLYKFFGRQNYTHTIINHLKTKKTKIIPTNNKQQ